MMFRIKFVFGFLFAVSLNALSLRAEGMKVKIVEHEEVKGPNGKEFLESAKKVASKMRDVELVEAAEKGFDVRILVHSMTESDLTVVFISVEESLYFGADEFQRRDLEKGIRSTKFYYGKEQGDRPIDVLRDRAAPILLYFSADKKAETIKSVSNVIKEILDNKLSYYKDLHQYYSNKKVGE